MLSKVLLVGGGENLIESIRRNYASLGVEIGWWWHGDRGASHGSVIPKGADAVVLLIDVVDHSTVEAMWRMCRAAGVPIVRTSRRWIIARRSLLDAGLGDENFKLESEPLEAIPPLVRKALAAVPEAAAEATAEATVEAAPPPPAAPKAAPKAHPPATHKTHPPPTTSGPYDPAGKPRAELLRVLKSVVAELITGHNVGNFRITDDGKISMEVRESLDLDLLLREE